MAKDYDLIVIGAGPGGTPAAMNAAMFGKRVLLIDKRDAPGGECLFEGCIPSKVLENAANRYYDVVTSKKFHIDSNSAQIHWEDVLKDKEEILQKRSQAALHKIMQMPNLTFMQGVAKFIDNNSIEVNGKRFSFENAIIASGAKISFPKIKGNGIDKVWTNKDVFYQKELPTEILFIGAGAISSELAQMFNKLGVKCHILERSERILKHLPKEAAMIVQEKMIKNGIDIEFNLQLESIDFEDDTFVVKYLKDNQLHTLKYKNVLMATGRVANIDDLALENAGVEYDKKGIIVNEYLQTSQSNIYACGDCINAPKFAHTATYEAGVAIHNIFAPSPHKVDYDKNSWVLFSDPQVAIAGIDSQSAAKRGLDFSVQTYEFKTEARSQIDKSIEGFIKFIIDNNTKSIIGVEIVNEDASSLVGEATLIVANKLKSMDVQKAIHPHPTLTEAFGKLAQQIFFQSMMRR